MPRGTINPDQDRLVRKNPHLNNRNSRTKTEGVAVPEIKANIYEIDHLQNQLEILPQ
jgi:hypothetical protein